MEMRVLHLLVLGTALYVISGQQISDRQSKQMSLFNGISHPYYAVNPFFNLLSAPYFGLQKDNSKPKAEQPFYSSNANQEGAAELSINKQPIIDDPSARLFLSGNVGFAATSVTNNFLIKTSYVFTTATGTVCKLTTCIPSTLFTGPAANEFTSVICRKRREVLEFFGETVRVQPSTVQPAMTVTTILDAGFKPVPEERQMEMSPYPVMIESSLDDPSDPEKTRKKRFAFILTTTLTSYSLVSGTYTITIKPAADSALTCRPFGYGICGV